MPRTLNQRLETKLRRDVLDVREWEIADANLFWLDEVRWQRSTGRTQNVHPPHSDRLYQILHRKFAHGSF